MFQLRLKTGSPLNLHTLPGPTRLIKRRSQMSQPRDEAPPASEESSPFVLRKLEVASYPHPLTLLCLMGHLLDL